MKTNLLLSVTLLAIMLTLPVMAFADPRPETIAEKMSTKFARGITNAATCFIELPKQTILTVRDTGAAGFAIGPLKGIVMTIYRGFVGGVEAAFFLVPQPGYYDPMIDPPYVFQGWEPKRDPALMSPQSELAPAPQEEH